MHRTGSGSHRRGVAGDLTDRLVEGPHSGVEPAVDPPVELVVEARTLWVPTSTARRFSPVIGPNPAGPGRIVFGSSAPAAGAASAPPRAAARSIAARDPCSAPPPGSNGDRPTPGRAAPGVGSVPSAAALPAPPALPGAPGAGAGRPGGPRPRGLPPTGARPRGWASPPPEPAHRAPRPPPAPPLRPRTGPPDAARPPLRRGPVAREAGRPEAEPDPGPVPPDPGTTFRAGSHAASPGPEAP